MATLSQLFREAQELERSLLQLYFDASETFGATRYNSFRVAAATQRAFERKARRRDKMLNDWKDNTTTKGSQP